jgi:hypothetical protein
MRHIVICTALAVSFGFNPLAAGARAQESPSDPLDIAQGGGNPPLTLRLADNTLDS